MTVYAWVLKEYERIWGGYFRPEVDERYRQGLWERYALPGEPR